VRPNQVWATDISYIPMTRGFVRGDNYGGRLSGNYDGR